MSDPLSDRRRTHEEDYFQKKDRELVEKMRQQAKAEAQLRELGETSGGHRSAADSRARRIGIHTGNGEAAAAHPGSGNGLGRGWGNRPGTQDGDRRCARTRDRGRSVADRQLAEWLDRQPTENVYQRARRLIRALFASGGRFNLTPDDLLKYCEAIAEASGGLFGIGRVSSEERATLARIADEIKTRQK